MASSNMKNIGSCGIYFCVLNNKVKRVVRSWNEAVAFLKRHEGAYVFESDAKRYVLSEDE
jgi:hypothetical protein